MTGKTTAATAIHEAMQLGMQLLQTRAIVTAALLILPYAGVIIGLDVAAHYGSVTNAELPVQFYIASDGSFGEFLEYSMTTAVAVMSGLLWWRQREIVYLANSVLFGWLTLDNWLGIHETFGQSFANSLAWIDFVPVEAGHLAEAILLLGIGVFWLVALALALRSASGKTVAFSLVLAGCVVGAALFGVLVDLLVVWGEQDAVFHAVLVFIEDGGEFAMLILAFLFTVSFFDLAYMQDGRNAG